MAIPDTIEHNFGVLTGTGDAKFQRNANGDTVVHLFSVDPPEAGVQATNPVDLVLVDLNDDGKNDVVTANQTTNNISVRINTSTPPPP